MQDSEFVLLATFSSIEDATSARIALDAAEIPFSTNPNQSSAPFPSLEVLSGIDIFVPQMRLSEARDIIANRKDIASSQPDGDENPPHLLDAEEAVVKPTRTRARRVLPVLLYTLGVFAAGLLIGLRLSGNDPASRIPLISTPEGFTEVSDLNFDGESDSWVTYSHYGVPLRATEDVNFDGKVDAWTSYDKGRTSQFVEDYDFDGAKDTWHYYFNGLITRTEGDSNRDGNVDSWTYFTHDRPTSTSYDVDRDGNAEVFDQYKDGVCIETIWKPQGQEVVRKHVYEQGILREIYTRAPSGKLELSTRLDRYGASLSLNDAK